MTASLLQPTPAPTPAATPAATPVPTQGTIAIVSGRALSPGDPGVRLDAAIPLPAWAWVLIVLAAIAISLWSYRNSNAGSRTWRLTLATLRTLTLILLAILLSGPRLVFQPERTERDWVVFLSDRSASMSVADVSLADGSRQSRDQQLTAALNAASPALAKLAADRSTLWLGFDSGAFDLPAPLPTETTPAPTWQPAEGRSTDLTRPLEQALSKVAARPVSGIVVLSDGRFASPTSRTVLQKLAAEQIPIFVVPLGSTDNIQDLAVDRVEAPSRAFVDDIVPVNVRITRSGPNQSIDPPPGQPSTQTQPWKGRVQLVESSTGVILDEIDLATLNDASDAATRSTANSSTDSNELQLSLAARPSVQGRQSWTVRLDPQGPDLTQDNNQRPISVDLTDRSLRVVYFDGYPRWEYRYMRGLLVRESSIKSSTLLLSASRKYLQEGSEILTSIPTSESDWSTIDVVIIGDVRPELFSPEQLENLKRHVAKSGAGLLWIAGAAATPLAWGDSPLADLLPFNLRKNTQDSGVVSVSTLPVVVEPTPAADRLGLLRLGEDNASRWPDSLSDPRSGWSRLWWTQRIDASLIKPTAETLATLSSQPGSEDTSPALLTMRYGAGRIVYVATDETWRWRFGRGEALYERFWLPIIRLLARESLASSGQPAILEVAPDRPLVDAPVRVSLRLIDESLAGRLPQQLTVRVRPEGATSTANLAQDPTLDTGTTLTLLPEQSRDGRPSGYATTWTPPDAGRYTLTATDAALAVVGQRAGSPSVQVEVVSLDDERRAPQSDHAALAALATQTNGAVITPDQLSTLAEKLPNRQLRVLGTPVIDPLWDRPWVYILFMTLLTLEWLGRKWLRLA
jgi:hypothetical protein